MMKVIRTNRKRLRRIRRLSGRKCVFPSQIGKHSHAGAVLRPARNESIEPGFLLISFTGDMRVGVRKCLTSP
jgi:hypothetical protein